MGPKVSSRSRLVFGLCISCCRVKDEEDDELDGIGDTMESVDASDAVEALRSRPGWRSYGESVSRWRDGPGPRPVVAICRRAGCVVGMGRLGRQCEALWSCCPPIKHCKRGITENDVLAARYAIDAGYEWCGNDAFGAD